MGKPGNSSRLLKLSSWSILVVLAVWWAFLAARSQYLAGNRTVVDESERLDSLFAQEIYPAVAGLKDFTAKALPAENVKSLPGVIGRIESEAKEVSAISEDIETAMGGFDAPKEDLVRARIFSIFNAQRSEYGNTKARARDLGFPPSGEDIGVVGGQIFYPLQQRFSPVNIQVVANRAGLVIYGAALCEEVHEGDVVLTPCIFRDVFPLDPENKIKSKLEVDLAETVRKGTEIAFVPWSRYAIGYTDCLGGAYRTTIQFGNTSKDQYVSLRVPFSSHPVDALAGLELSAHTPCNGLDLFLSPESVVSLLSHIDTLRANRKRVPGGLPQQGWEISEKG